MAIESQNSAKDPPLRTRRYWIRLAATLALLVAIVIGGWVALMSSLNTSNPILVVEGNSMLPTLHNGDVVVLRGVTADDIVASYREGEKYVIVYFSQIYKRHIIHRVHALAFDDAGQLEGFVMKGDNNRLADPGVVPESALVGKVVTLIPTVGLVIQFFRSPQGTIILSLIIMFLIVWSVVDETGRRRTRRT
ncbi:MAG: signal peptidase I [Candidatus Bathyarchaeia archaeon]